MSELVASPLICHGCKRILSERKIEPSRTHTHTERERAIEYL